MTDNSSLYHDTHAYQATIIRYHIMMLSVFIQNLVLADLLRKNVAYFM